MKTVLNLIGEFGALHDAKVRSGGSLPPEDEKRWAELKAVLPSLDGSDWTRAGPRGSSDYGERYSRAAHGS